MIPDQHILAWGKIAPKIQALLQRDKGRDLYDVAHCLITFKGLDQNKLIDLFLKYLAFRDLQITRAQAQQRMFAKMENSQFLADIQSLLPATEAKSLTESSIKSAIQLVLSALVDKLPGDPWVHTDAKKKQFDIDW